MHLVTCEKLHIKFLKYVLGVHRKTTNVAVMGELGRYPIKIDVFCDTVEYFERFPPKNNQKLIDGSNKKKNCFYLIRIKILLLYC